MKIQCSKCGFLIDRDKYIGGKKVEEYQNIYGTRCPKCNEYLRPMKKPSFVSDGELRMELLREEIRERLRKKIRRK